MRSDSPPNSNTAMIGTAKRPTDSAIQTPTAAGSSRLRAPGSSDGVCACNLRQLLANAVCLGHVESGHLPRTSRGRVDNQPCQVEQAIERSLPCLDELDPIEGDQRGDLEQCPARDQHVARPDLVSPSPVPEVRDQHGAEHDDPGDHTRDRRRDISLARIKTQGDRDDERDSARDRPPQQKDTSIKPACRALHASDANARDAPSQRTCIRTPTLSSSLEASGRLVGPPVFKTGVRARARVLLGVPSASARSPPREQSAPGGHMRVTAGPRSPRHLAMTSTSTPAPGMIHGGTTRLTTTPATATRVLTYRRRQRTVVRPRAATSPNHGAKFASPWADVIAGDSTSCSVGICPIPARISAS